MSLFFFLRNLLYLINWIKKSVHKSYPPPTKKFPQDLKNQDLREFYFSLELNARYHVLTDFALEI